MKKINKILLLATLLVGLFACQEEPEIPSPVIQLGESEVVLSSSGAAVSVAYLVENALEGEKISVAHEAEWLTVATNKVRTIEISASENTESEERTATITISYKGAEDVNIAVTQSCYDTPLRLEILDVTAADLYFSVFTNDPELTWIPMVSSKAYFDSQRSDSALFDDNLEYFAYLAEIRDLTLEEYLTDMLAVGTIENILFENLEPNTEYVLYAYGITPKGERTTDVVWEAFTTEAPWEGDLTFEFNVMEENHRLFFDVTPSHTGVPYYFGIVKKALVEEWFESYNTTDLREAIQKGEIDANIDILIDYEFISDRSGFYSIFNETGRLFDESMACDGATTYLFFAAKWNENCELIGEVSSYEHTTLPVEPSDNVITLKVENITQSSADMVTTTSNNDPYTVIAVESSTIAEMDDKTLYDYLTYNYDYLLDEYTFSGGRTRTYTHLEPNTNYTFVAFGYLAGTQTTSYILREEFTTTRSDDPKDCTFEFEWTVDTEEAWIKIDPSDDGHHFFWGIYDARYTAQEVKDYITDVVIADWYEGDFAAFASWRLSQGTVSETVGGLYPSTDYKIGVVIMDYESGEFLTDVIFSETFTTKAVEYADITIEVIFNDYYDIQELVSAGYRNYKEYLQYGDALLPATVEVSGDYSVFYYTVYARDLSDPELYPDSIFLEYLPQDGSHYDATLFPLTYNEDDPYDLEMYTMCAVAYDHNGKFSHIFRRPFGCLKGNVGNPDNFVDPTARNLVAPIPEWRPLEKFGLVSLGAERSTPLLPKKSVAPAEKSVVVGAEEAKKESARLRAQAQFEARRESKPFTEERFVVSVK